MIEANELCTCCSACYNVCPETCISMKEDKEGFLYPIVNKESCIECNLCVKVCPALKRISTERDNISQCYAAWNKNNDIRPKSSSGGVFSAFAEEILENRGVVFGASFNEGFSVIHKGITKKEDLELLRGSKYIQSYIGNSFKEVEEYLKNGQLVLFSGTPCQVDGLYSYLRKDYSNLITIDIICHGVPSQKIFDLYMRETHGIYKDKVANISFRDKENDGWPNNLKITLKNTDNNIFYSRYSQSDSFFKGYLSALFYRRSCYKCNYARVSRVSDITIADFWGIGDKEAFNYDISKGVSLILTNNHKGGKLLEDCSEKIFYVRRSLEEAKALNTNLHTVSKEHPKREFFYICLNKKTFNYSVKKSLKRPFFKRAISRLKRLV